MHFDRRIYVQGAMYRHYIPCSSVRAVEKFIAETQRRIRPSCPSPPPIDRNGECCFLSPPRRKKILFFREEKVAGSIVRRFQASARF